MSDQLAPFIPIIVKNPLREKQAQVQALIDTGYDRFIAVSVEQFLDIGLDEYEIPKRVLNGSEATIELQLLEDLNNSSTIM